MENALKELMQLIKVSKQPQLKTNALSALSSISGNQEGVDLILDQQELVSLLITLLDDCNRDIVATTINILVNVSGDARLKANESLVKAAIKKVLGGETGHDHEAFCMLLSNLTRSKADAETVVDIFEKLGVSIQSIAGAISTKKCEYLSTVLMNLSQVSKVRKHIMDRQTQVIRGLLPFTEYQESHVKRSAIVGILRNCCFDYTQHSWLLGEDVDILPRLLLPLAGNTEYDDEDNDKLPVELQYLPEDKERERDPLIRHQLLEAITMLCNSRSNRELIRDKNAYAILRELHKHEKDQKVLLTCEHLVNILIRTEDEIGQEVLSNVEVPEEMTDELNKMDELFLN